VAAAGTVEFWKYWEGRVVDKAFPLLRCLGSGTSSAVFLTEAAGEKGRRAALRLVRANSPGAELQLSRWQRASKLSHPHLIRLLSMGRCQLDDTAMLYLVMEYADEDVSQVLPERALTEAETIQMLGPVLSALRYVHRQGFVHGHVKPANILAVDDQVKISSDGLWSMGGRSEHRAIPGPYDPPEIATRGTSPAGDVWSLGVTLVEVLTQHVLTQQQGLVVPEGVPPGLADVVRHCLQSDPQSRWTLDQIAESLGGPAPIAVPLASPVLAPEKKLLRWRYVVPLAALASLAVAGMFMFRSTPVAHSEIAKAPVVQAQAQPGVVQPENVQPEKKKAPPEKAPVQTKPMVSGEILDQVMPAVSQHAQSTVRGKFMVDVRVHVDPSGSVTDAKIELRGPSRYFADSSLEAARKWRFRPSDAEQDWILHFKFEKSGFTVVPAHVSP
jgi:TonB family protein